MSYTWTPADYQTLAQLSAAQDPPIDPVQVALVLFEESGLDPSSPGPAGASPPVGGLNQMSSDNLTSLGLTRGAWLAMSAAQQLPYIFKWWGSLANADNGGNFPQDAGTLLALNFLPGSFKTVGAGSNVNAVVAGKNGPYASYYASNISLDPDGTGTITPATCQIRLVDVANSSSRWPAIQQAISNYSLYNPSILSNSTGKLFLYVISGLALGGAAYYLSGAPQYQRTVRRLRRAI